MLSLHGLTEQTLKIGRRARPWIGLVANIGLGNVYQAGHMFFFHALGCQTAGNADAGFKRFEPGHKGLATARDAADMRQFLKLGWSGLVVPSQHGVDHQSIGQAVV